MTDANPHYSSQWQLSQVGDIEAVWEDYSGVGINVGVYDDGVERTHKDPVDNYDASLHFSGDDRHPNSITDGHGTSVAGIIAASNNNLRGVGIAYDASISGVDYLNDFQGDWVTNLATLRWSAGFDIVNDSLGIISFHGDNRDIGDSLGANEQMADAFEYTIATSKVMPKWPNEFSVRRWVGSWTTRGVSTGRKS